MSTASKQKRTTVSVEFKGEQYDQLMQLKEKLNGESFPSILRNFTFAYAELQEKAAASLADGSAAQLAEVEQRLAGELHEMRREMLEARRELNATAALLDSLVKLFLTHTPVPPEAAREELVSSAKSRHEKVLKATVQRFDGERARVLDELADRVASAQYTTGADD